MAEVSARLEADLAFSRRGQ